jgi:CHAD domain-containing protein
MSKHAHPTTRQLVMEIAAALGETEPQPLHQIRRIITVMGADFAQELDVLRQRAVELQVYSHTVRVAHLDDLLATLTVLRRPKDLPRVQQLRALQRQRHEPRQTA